MSKTNTAPEVKPAIPPVIAGITHDQVKAYFVELSAIAGFGVGMSPVTPGQFSTWEKIGDGYETEYVNAYEPTAELAVMKHIANRPPTGIALAQKKLAEAQALLAKAQAAKETAAHV